MADLKYGKGKVFAKGNEQLSLYSWGAYRVNRFLYNIEKIRYYIVQPRLNCISWEDIKLQELEEWVLETKDKVQQALEGPGEYKTGKWCTFCPVRLAHACHEIIRKDYQEDIII